MEQGMVVGHESCMHRVIKDLYMTTAIGYRHVAYLLGDGGGVEQLQARHAVQRVQPTTQLQHGLVW